MGSVYFRAGVVTVVQRADGAVLAFERGDTAGQWQLPQGGIEVGETPKVAAWRELKEETGLSHRHVRMIGEHADWTVYLWPQKLQRRGRLGQAHRWFFFEPLGPDLTPVPDGTEFSNWRWMMPHELIEQVVEFRRAPYRQVFGG